MTLAFTLDDPRPIALSAPYTYYVPSEKRLAAIGPGDLVQLLFRSLAPSPMYAVERMWVRVQLVEGDHLAGVLESEPYDMPGVEKGERVRFERFHAISVIFADPARKPIEARTRDYWDRCVVDACILDDGVKVGSLYREAPKPMGEKDKHPDSGWRIRGDARGCDAEELSARDVRYVAIGVVLNRDDSWLPLIDEATGAAFEREFETNTYRRVLDS